MGVIVHFGFDASKRGSSQNILEVRESLAANIVRAVLPHIYLKLPP